MTYRLRRRSPASSLAVALSVMLCFTLAGCASPYSRTGDAVRNVLERLDRDGFHCGGPSEDASDVDQWTCTKTVEGPVDLVAVVDGNQDGLRQVVAIVDQSRLHEPQPSTVSRYFDQIADTQGQAATPLRDWLHAHIPDGGQAQVGPAFVSLDSLRAVTHLSLFFGDGS